MRLISYRDGGTGDMLGVVSGDRWVPAGALLPAGPKTMAELLAGGPAGIEALRSAATTARIADEGRSLDEVELQAPVPRPGKVVAIGRNYREHIDEEGAAPPAAPLVFSKWPSSVIGDGAEIHWDPALTAQVDYEAELAVVIGRVARRVTEADALDHVLGYTCLNDVSARDLQFGDGQWTRGKSLDTFCPMGPMLVTADEIADPQDLDITCRVDGELLQSANTRQMYFGVAAIISYCSQSFSLEPGDVIATGTPGGVGIFRDPPVLLGDGAEVDGRDRVHRPAGQRLPLRPGRGGHHMRSGAERFLVTGALGCIGAWTVRALVHEGAQVTVFDVGRDPRRLRLIMPDAELTGVRFEVGDIASLGDLERVIDEHEITNVIHLAALQVPFCRADPPRGALVNVVGTVNVFEAARRRADRMAPVVYTSSMAVYTADDADPVTGRLTVDAYPHPPNHYGVYKQANEGNARIYWLDSGLSSVGLRPMTVYGIGRDQGMTSGPTKAIVAAALGQPYRVSFSGPTHVPVRRRRRADPDRGQPQLGRGRPCLQPAR